MLLAGICVLAQPRIEDQGVANVMVHGAIILTVMGWAAWIILRTRWSFVRRWGGAVLILGLLSVHYFQLSPIKLVNNGDVGIVNWQWRWAPPDGSLDAETIVPKVALDWQSTPHDYPKFLGNGYWAEVMNVTLDSNWKANPPQEIWRQPIGAGWSSYAIVGDYAVTQEQRGEQELVACYRVETGKLLWTHADNVRFDPGGGGSFGGVGPQATPTIYEGTCLHAGRDRNRQLH